MSMLQPSPRAATGVAPGTTSGWLLACATDRLAARTLAAARLGPDWLPALHGVWRRPEAINWPCLPPAFLLAASHGPGRRLAVPNLAAAHPPRLARHAAAWQRQAPGARIFAEEYPPEGSTMWQVLVRAGRARSLRGAAGEWLAPAQALPATLPLLAAAEAVSAGLLQASVAFRLGGRLPLFIALRAGAQGAD